MYTYILEIDLEIILGVCSESAMGSSLNCLASGAVYLYTLLYSQISIGYNDNCKSSSSVPNSDRLNFYFSSVPN